METARMLDKILKVYDLLLYQVKNVITKLLQNCPNYTCLCQQKRVTYIVCRKFKYMHFSNATYNYKQEVYKKTRKYGHQKSGISFSVYFKTQLSFFGIILFNGTMHFMDNIKKPTSYESLMWAQSMNYKSIFKE